MNYSFFGTCANDYEQLFGCLDTIIEQTLEPTQIILVNSGVKKIKRILLEKLINKNIKLVYIKKNLSRVCALNVAIDFLNTTYAFRFDTRTRFSNCYAENSLKILQDKYLGASVVGGVPEIISEKNSSESKLCSEIMNRSYIFFYPKHRNKKYSGLCSSIYLGCFKTNLLKDIRFNENEALLSEDSLIINDFLKKGFKAYLSSKIKVSYVSRSSFINILKLFNTYGFCRGNTILISKKLFISSRHFFVFTALIILLIILSSFSLLFLLPLFILLMNIIGEIISSGKIYKMHIPFYATLCQFSWILGFLWSLLTIFSKNKSVSNFIY